MGRPVLRHGIAERGQRSGQDQRARDHGALQHGHERELRRGDRNQQHDRPHPLHEVVSAGLRLRLLPGEQRDVQHLGRHPSEFELRPARRHQRLSASGGTARLRQHHSRSRSRRRPEAPAQRLAQSPNRRGQLRAHDHDLQLPRQLAGDDDGLRPDGAALSLRRPREPHRQRQLRRSARRGRSIPPRHDAPHHAVEHNQAGDLGFWRL